MGSIHAATTVFSAHFVVEGSAFTFPRGEWMRYVFCLGMYRSCSTWQYEILSQLAESYRHGVRLGFIEGIRFDEIPDPAHARLKVLKAHDFHSIFVRELEAGTALPVYAYRDLRDVAFSFMHKAVKTFNKRSF